MRRPRRPPPSAFLPEPVAVQLGPLALPRRPPN
jgi:hypothetical protein